MSYLGSTGSTSSSSSSSTSSVSNGRYWGLASGLDVDSIVKGLVQGEQNKIDKVKQSEQVLQWQQTDYQSIITALQNFQTAYLQLGSSTSMATSNMYNAYDVSVSSSAFTATANSDAVAGTHNVEIDQTATTASIAGDKLARAIQGTANVNLLDSNGVKALQEYARQAEAVGDSDPSFNINVDGVTKQISFSSTDDYSDIASLINSKLKAAFGTDSSGNVKVLASVDASTGKLSIASNGGYQSKATITYNTNNDARLLKTMAQADELQGISDPSMTINISVTGTDGKPTTVSKAITFSSTDDYSDIQSLINNKLEAAFGNDSGGNQLVKAAVDSKGNVTLSQAGKDSSGNFAYNTISNYSYSQNFDAASVLGIASNSSNRLNVNQSVLSLFGSKLNTSAIKADGSFSVTVNGTQIKLNVNDSFATNINAINNAGAGVTVKYNTDTDQINVLSTSSGAAGNITLSGDGAGFFSAILGSDTAQTTVPSGFTASGDPIVGTGVTAGVDTIIKVDGQTYTRSSNNFTIDGIGFSVSQQVLKSQTPVTSTVTLSGDISTTEKGIQDFLTAYNTLLDAIYTQTDTKPNDSYPPLTDSQKSSMTQDQIDAYNKTAQQGRLYNDDTLTSLTSELEDLVYQPITASDGKKISLYDIGITTDDTDYTKGGKLYITPANQQKLADALTNHPDEVRDLFINSSNILYNMDHSTTDAQQQQQTRMTQEGIINRINDEINNYIGSQGTIKGNLLVIAGKQNDSSQYDNDIYNQLKGMNTQITDYTTDLKNEETRYYNEFEQLEMYMQQMNTQSSWLSSFGGSSS